MHFRVLSAIGRARALWTAGLCTWALGCAPAPLDEQVTAQTQDIVGGEASGVEQDGVVLLRALIDGVDLLCSAALVGPNLIATARHCVAYLSEGQFSCSVRGEPLDNPSGGGRLGLHLPAASLEVYGRKTPRKTPLARGRQVISTLSSTVCHNDLAFVVLDRALDLPIVPLRVGRPALRQEAAVLIGYGLDGTQQVLDYQTQTRLQKRDLEIAAVGPDSLADGVTTIPPRTLLLEGPSGCVGDSGGPLLAASTGALLGVFSLLQGEACGAPTARNQLTHVPPFRALIDEAFAAAGGQPLLEEVPDPGPAGNAGAPAEVASEGGGAGEPSTTGVAGAPASAGAPSVTPADAGTPRSSSCGLVALHGADASLGGCLLTLLVGAALRARRRERRAAG